MKQAIKNFNQYLDSKNLKLTPERKVVLQEIFIKPGHLEVEELIYRLRRKKKNVSRATIYRTLELLVDSGMVRKFDLGHGHSHYEHISGHPHHEHMVCLECGKVLEFSDKKIESSLKRVCENSGFKHCAHYFQVFGYCKNCQ